MRAHHTKNKGDLGVLHAQLDLARRGYMVLLPLTEHAPFDLVAYKEDRFLRVQVKYRSAKNGCVSLRLASFWADRHGVHAVAVDRTALDLFCVYCPDTDRCYYVDVQSCPPGKALLCIRVQPTRNAQSKRIRWAKDFEDIPATSLGVVAGASRALEGAARMRQIVPGRHRLYAPIAQVD